MVIGFIKAHVTHLLKGAPRLEKTNTGRIPPKVRQIKTCVKIRVKLKEPDRTLIRRQAIVDAVRILKDVRELMGQYCDQRNAVIQAFGQRPSHERLANGDGPVRSRYDAIVICECVGLVGVVIDADTGQHAKKL